MYCKEKRDMATDKNQVRSQKLLLGGSFGQNGGPFLQKCRPFLQNRGYF